MYCPSAKLDATGQRWIAALQGPYNFKIHYKTGKIEPGGRLIVKNRQGGGTCPTISEVEVQAILDSGGAADVSIPFAEITQEENPIIVKNLLVPGVAQRPNRDWREETIEGYRNWASPELEIGKKGTHN